MRQIILFCFFLSFSLSGQNSYLNFLKPDKEGQNHLLTFSHEFLYTTNYKAFRSGGFSTTIGLNLARLFTKKFILGVCYEMKGFKGITGQKFSSQFISDFDSNYNTVYANEHDSVCASIISKAIANNNVGNAGGGSSAWFGGNYCGYYGIMFSPFPQKFGGLLFIFKKGYREYATHGANSYKDWPTEDHPGLYFPHNYSFEVSFKPYAIIKNSYVYHKEFSFEDVLKCLTVSFYYEKLYLKNADFEGLKFSQMVSASFMRKYGVTENYGFKIGFAFY